jgi:hypothetical protein
MIAQAGLPMGGLLSVLLEWVPPEGAARRCVGQHERLRGWLEVLNLSQPGDRCCLAPSQRCPGGGPWKRVAGDWGARDALWAAARALRDNEASRLVQDA